MLNPLYGQALLIILLLIAVFYSFYLSFAIGITLWSLHTLMRYYYLLPKKNLKGEHILITGGGMGIGKELAVQFSKFEPKITIAELNLSMAEQVKQELESEGFKDIQVFQCDVTDLNRVQEVFSEAVKTFGEIDILINNAGIVTGKTILENEYKMMAKTMDVNITSHMYTTKLVLESMIKRDHGHIVSISSAAGYLPGPGLADYNASKFGVVGFHEALCGELQLRKSNVQATCICPWFVDTDMAKSVDGTPGFKKLGLQETVTRIVNAIRQNEHIVVIPFKVNFLIFLKQFLPRIILVGLMDSKSKETHQKIENAKNLKQNEEESKKKQ